MSEQIRAEEITSALREEFNNFEMGVDVYEEGKVLQVIDGVATVHGLSNVMSGEVVQFSSGTVGLALNLQESSVGVSIMGDDTAVKEGDTVKRTNSIASVPVGEALLGRVVDTLGNPIDGKGSIHAKEKRLIEVKAPSIIDRKNVHEPVQTGIKVIDAMIPVGRGQRELIIGDRQTGKTAIALDIILNQKKENMKCFYVAIGQKQSTVAILVKELEKRGAMEYTTVISASAATSATLQFLAPYAGVTMAEYFRDNGQHALIIYDDLTKQAQAYRQISLLLRRPPGREAYPGDVFYLHSRLLERAAKLSDDAGAGSLTAFPIIETQAGDVSAYIPTNVISITDGQIFLDSNLFNRGQRPAIDIGLSVSRVGGDAQIKAMKQASGSIKGDLQQYRELEAFSQFASDLDEVAKKQLNRGERLMELLKQSQYQPYHVVSQALSMWTATNGFFDDLPIEKVLLFEEYLIESFTYQYSKLYKQIEKNGKISDEQFKEIKKIATERLKSFISKHKIKK